VKARLGALFQNGSIAYKLFLSMVLLTVLSMVLIVLAIHTTYSESMRENEIKYNLLATNTIKSRFDMTIELIQGTADTLFTNRTILEGISAGPPHPLDIGTLVDNIRMMQPFIEGVHILGANGVQFSTSPQSGWSDLLETYCSYWDTESQPAKNGRFWSSRKIAISHICPVYNEESLSALIVLDINYEYLREMFLLSAIQLNEKVLVADSMGNTLFGFPHTTSFEPFLNQYPQLLQSDFIQEEGNVYGVDSIIVSEKLRLADWRIVRIIQTEQVTAQTRQVIGTLEIAGILLLLVCLGYSFWISRAVTRPVKALKEACVLVEQGDLDVRVHISTKDELGKLGHTFNMMLGQLQRNLDMEIASQKRKADMQFQILQAQINPHFLYNTLDSIRWLAVMKNIGSIAEMCSSLINLLKYNLSSMNATTTLREELESVKNYITIQKFRYSDNFDFSIRVDEEALDCQVVRFILQPLVENSIVHGFEDVSEGYSICIAAFFAEEQLHIKVIDNGAGIAPGRVEQLNSTQNMKHRFNHIGVANIRERIKLYFGEEYDVYYDSEPHVGTIAELILPICPIARDEKIPV